MGFRYFNMVNTAIMRGSGDEFTYKVIDSGE
jgi:hypothetical protein